MIICFREKPKICVNMFTSYLQKQIKALQVLRVPYLQIVSSIEGDGINSCLYNHLVRDNEASVL